MAYSTEVIFRARQRLAEAKAARDKENTAALRQAYKQLPRLRQIDNALQKTMVQAAQAVFAGGDAETAMEQAKTENLALQQEREKLLKENGISLEETPICPDCGGIGYVGSRMCHCLRQLCSEEQVAALGKIATGPERFSAFRLDYYSDIPDPRYQASPRTIMEKTWKYCLRYAANFAAKPQNLLFIGGTGLGKTYLAVCIAKEVAAAGFQVAYTPAITMFSKLEKARFSADEDARKEAETLKAAELLIIDDLGTEVAGQFVTAALYDLLNDRLLGGKPMLITTNLTVEEAGKRYSPQIASRLYGEFSRLTFVGSDIRVLRNRVL